MKVLRLIGSLDPRHGGPPVSSVNSCIATQRAGAETTFAFPVATDGPGALAIALERLRAANVRIKTFPTSSEFGERSHSLGMCQGLARWLQQNYRRFDLVHCHGAWQMVTLLSAIGAGGTGPALVLSPHESMTRFDMEQSSNPAIGMIKASLRHFYARRMDLFLMSSHLEAKTSLPDNITASERVAVIPHPVLDETCPLAIRRPDSVTGTAFTIGYLGRLHRKKNVHIILQALRQMPETVSLSIGGSGPERDNLMAQAKSLHLEDRIKWWGFLEDRDKERFFDHIDMLLMPSVFECFGMAAAEAMARGVPALVAPDTGIAEIIQAHGGGEVVPAEALALQTAIERLSADPSRLKSHRECAQRAAQQVLSFHACGSATLQLYKKTRAIRHAA